jgi:hypothetical protein
MCGQHGMTGEYFGADVEVKEDSLLFVGESSIGICSRW